jgi:PAS domain-containing protein
MGAPVSNALKTSRKRNTSGTLKASGIPKISGFGDANSLLLLIDGVVDYAIYMLDPEGRVLSWNSGAVRLKGYTPDEIIGESFSRFYTPEDLQAGVSGSIQAATS